MKGAAPQVNVLAAQLHGSAEVGGEGEGRLKEEGGLRGACGVKGAAPEVKAFTWASSQVTRPASKRCG